MYKSIASMIFLAHMIILFSWFVGANMVIQINMSFMNISLGYPIIMDWMSNGFLSWVLLISSVVFIYSSMYMGETPLNKRFISLVFLFVVSMALLIISPSLIGMMIGWDGLGITSFLLVIFYQNTSSLKSGMITIYINRFGDVMMIFAIIMSVSIFFDNSNMSFAMPFMIIMMISLAAMTKSAQIPFSAWLPMAMAAPTPVSSLVHSSTLVTAGIYLLLRFYFMMKNIFLNNLFMIVTMMTSVSSGIIACMESDFKKVVAMSTLSQLGLMMFMLSMNEMKISFFHMISHALFKALLFLSCGMMIMLSLGIQDSRFKGGMKSKSYFMPLMFSLSSLSLSGFPYLTGFFSKDFMIESTYNYNNSMFFFLLLIFACVLTSIYSFRLFFIGMKMYRSNEKSFSNIESKKFLSMSILYMWSIFLGKMMANFLMFSMMSIVMNIFKSVSLLILSLGMWLSASKIWMKSMKMKILLSEMIFLNQISSKYFSDSIMKMKNLLDSKWLELTGPMGAFKLILSSNNIQMNKKIIPFKYFILIIFYAMIMV